MGGTSVRFILSDIQEHEIRDEYGYDIFEPTVGLEIGGKNIFEEFGERGAKSVIIMPSIEDALPDCMRMAGLQEHAQLEYLFSFLGTGWGIRLGEERDELEVVLEVDDSMGPAGVLENGSYPVGRVTVREWIDAVVNLAENVLDLFWRLNPRLYAITKGEWFQLHQLQSWLTDKG
ncbi:MAG: hypothetical protein E3J35_08475 [Methanomassiliicoccales archaeon]|nr:MAG: hypothetical protein E3J35_08475 [Methanomassiliicoccales archaeon]